jgi:hypothetical protein
MICPDCKHYYSRVAKDWGEPVPEECYKCGIYFGYPNFERFRQEKVKK